jgi:RNA polymerase sigma-70 factor (ECF subfamily)
MDAAPDTATSSALLRRAQAGDEEALTALVTLYLPRLRRWASGRIPGGARTLLETNDVVQETLIAAVRNLRRVEIRGEGAFQAYLRRALANRLTDLYRVRGRHPVNTAVDSAIPSPAPSPIEQLIGAEALDQYEAALARLGETDRQAIILRVELCCGYEEIGAALGKSSAAHARVTVSRALARLAREMSHDRP